MKKNGAETSENLLSLRERNFLIILIIAIGLLRLFMLNNLSPIFDEFLHLEQAKELVFPASVLLKSGFYTRFLPLTYGLAFLFHFLPVTVTIARIPGVITALLTGLLFYFLLRRYNKTVALLAGVVFSFSPWVSMMSVIVREYVYLLPLHLCLGISLFDSVNAIIDKKYTYKRFLFDIAVLAGLVIYIFRLDSTSLIMTLPINYVIAGIYFFALSWKENVGIIAKKIVPISIAIVSLIILVATILQRNYLDVIGFSINISFKFDNRWILYLFGDQQYGSLIFQGVFLVLGILSALKLFRTEEKDRLKLFSGISFLVILYIFSFHFGYHFRPRYIFMVMPWICILLGYGVLSLRELLMKELNIKNLSIPILLLLTFNWASLSTAFAYQSEGKDPITDLVHQDVEIVANKICVEREEELVLITSLPVPFDFYCDKGFTKIISYPAKTKIPNSVLIPLLNKYEKGYFVIDDRRRLHLVKQMDQKDLSLDLDGWVLPLYERFGKYNIYQFDTSLNK